MATTKITITLEEDQVEAVRRLVTARRARSVSGFVKHAVDVALQDVNGWAAMLAEALDATGGPPTRQERAWASRVLSSGERAKGKRRNVA